MAGLLDLLQPQLADNALQLLPTDNPAARPLFAPTQAPVQLGPAVAPLRSMIPLSQPQAVPGLQSPQTGAVPAAEPTQYGPQPAMPSMEGITPRSDHDKVPDDVMAIVQEAAAKYNVDPKLILSVIQQESSFNPKSYSSAKAAGYMQLIPSTARELGVTNVWDARQNIMGGTKYLRQQLDTFGDVKLALAAYNAGPGAVNKYGRKIPPYRETQDYVRKVLAYYWGWK